AQGSVKPKVGFTFNKVNWRARLQARKNWSNAAIGLGQEHLHVADIALAEAALAVAEVELPHTDEFFRVAERAHAFDIVEHPDSPVLQRLGVTGREVFEMEQPEIAGAGDRIA